jgi:hypothetical protein
MKSTGVSRHDPRDWVRLVAIVLLVGAGWGLLLPWVGGQTGLRREIDRQLEQGVDPGALFYTDLPVMNRVDERLERLRHKPTPLGTTDCGLGFPAVHSANEP